MTENGGRRLGPVAAQVGSVCAIACGVERGGEAGVADAVLGEAVRDLHNRARTPFGEPAPRQKALTVVGAKLELAPRHSRPLDLSPPFKARVSASNLAFAREPRQARRRRADWGPCSRAKFPPRRIKRDRIWVESHGAVYLHHRRRGFLAWQGSGFGGSGRALAGARLYRAVAQA